MTLFECEEDECRPGNYCQNQNYVAGSTLSSSPPYALPPGRFRRKQYATVEIVLKEKKGFGLRAGEDISKYVANLSFRLTYIITRLWHRDTFVYEYVGHVVNEASFRKRLREYAAEGIRHFYFMMLQKCEVRFPYCSSFRSRSQNLFASISTQRNVEGSVASPTTAVTPTAT
jgi:[histone H3]-lysine36 N-trimethyltransferase